jgi:hypothetical protein
MPHGHRNTAAHATRQTFTANPSAVAKLSIGARRLIFFAKPVNVLPGANSINRIG